MLITTIRIYVSFVQKTIYQNYRLLEISRHLQVGKGCVWTQRHTHTKFQLIQFIVLLVTPTQMNTSSYRD